MNVIHDASVVEDQPIPTGVDGRAAATICLGSTPGDIIVAVTARDINSPLATFMPIADPTGPCLFALSADPVPGRECPGDCNNDGQVTIDELVMGVSIALGDTPMASCPSFDRVNDGLVTIDDVITAVNMALSGCTSG